MIARVDRDAGEVRDGQRRSAVDLYLCTRACGRHDPNAEAAQASFERRGALLRDGCPLVLAPAREAFGVAKFGPRARALPDVLVTIRQVEGHPYPGRENLALCEGVAGRGVVAFRAKRLAFLEEQLGVRGALERQRLGGTRQWRRRCERERRQEAPRAACHSRPPKSVSGVASAPAAAGPVRSDSLRAVE